MVVIRSGRVIANRTTLNSGKLIDATVLVGRGPGAEQLEQMRVGSTATVRWGLAGRPAFAIGGESVLLLGRKMQVTDDRELHPRTAVGIDRDKGRILLLVVDGRSKRSRGYTLVELARMMRRLGAEDALNLDGGGSSTMVGRTRAGKLALLNRASDGRQRSVADALVVKYRKPEPGLAYCAGTVTRATVVTGTRHCLSVFTGGEVTWSPAGVRSTDTSVGASQATATTAAASSSPSGTSMRAASAAIRSAIRGSSNCPANSWIDWSPSMMVAVDSTLPPTADSETNTTCWLDRCRAAVVRARRPTRRRPPRRSRRGRG